MRQYALLMTIGLIFGGLCQAHDVCPWEEPPSQTHILAQASLRGCAHGTWATLWSYSNSVADYSGELWAMSWSYDGIYRLFEEKRGVEVMLETTDHLFPSFSPSRPTDWRDMIAYSTGAVTCSLAVGTSLPYAPIAVQKTIERILSPRLEKLHTLAHTFEFIGNLAHSTTHRQGHTEKTPAEIETAAHHSRAENQERAQWHTAVAGGVSTAAAALYLFQNPRLIHQAITAVVDPSSDLSPLLTLCECGIFMGTVWELTPEKLDELGALWQNWLWSWTRPTDNLLVFLSTWGKAWLAVTGLLQFIHTPLSLHSTLDLYQFASSLETLARE